MGAGRGSRDEEAFGGEGSGGGESSFRFPSCDGDWNSFHSGGVGSLLGSVLKSGWRGNKGAVRLGVIETIRGRGDVGLTGGDGCGVSLGNGGMSHGRGMRSSEDGAVNFLIGGNGISSGVGDLFQGAGMIGVASLSGGDGVSDGGKSTWVGSGVSSIGTGGSYCSIDEYSLRCDPHGTRGSGGDAARGGCSGGRLGGVGMNGGANGDGSTRGGVVSFGITGGSDVVIGMDGGDFGI